MSLNAFGRFSTPSFLILVSLADGDKHGYAMMEDIETISGMKLGPGTLYGALSRLEENGLIEALDTDDRRRPYRLTESGKHELLDQLNGMKTLSSLGLQRLGSA